MARRKVPLAPLAPRYDPDRPPTPWERLPSEAPKSFDMMQAYMRLGPDKRTHQKVADKFKCTLQNVQVLACKYGWKIRAAAWDNRNAEVERRAEEKVRAANARKWAQREVKAHEQDYGASERLAERLSTMIDRVERDCEQIPLDPDVMDSLVRLCDRLIELRGKTFDRVRDEAERAAADAFDPTTATDEECRAYLERNGVKGKDVEGMTGT